MARKSSGSLAEPTFRGAGRIAGNSAGRLKRGLLTTTALAGIVLLAVAPIMPAQAQVHYGATGGEGGFGVGGDGGDAGQAGAVGAAGTPGGQAGTVGSPDGGDGGPGGGGGGGYSYIGSGNITLDLNGGDGGNGGSSSGGLSGSGGGGGDGVRISITDPEQPVSVSADIIGGDGGDSGSGSLGFDGISSGGGGGAGIVLQNHGALMMQGTAHGGDGGSSGMSGGGGGAGVILNAGGRLTNHGIVSGGRGDIAGGTGGAGVVMGSFGALINAGLITGGAGGDGAPAGAAIDLKAGGTIVNSGEILGGAGNNFSWGGSGIIPAGGTGSGGAPGGGGSAASQGDGGTGIVGEGVSIINSGIITGGFGYSGQTAISLSGSDNRLELRAGSAITGDVFIWGGTGNVFALGGDTDSSFNASSIGGQYRGFTGFEKTGASTWTLTGPATAVTPWTLIGGTLSVSSDDQLGYVSGALTFNGGTLENTQPISTARDITLTGIGGTFQTDADLTASGAISGSGTLAKTGTGTLTLSGNNTGFTGTTTVEAGRLEAGNIFAFAQGTAYIINGGTLGLNGFDLTVSLLLGTGGAVDLGSAVLTVDQNASTEYAGAIAGSGSFFKTGSGTLTLTGGSSDFTGTTTVSGGALLVGGPDGSGALGGNLDVEAGGTLGGSGTLGSGTGSMVTIASGGTIAPGNSTGTLTIDGDLVFAAGSRFAVEVNPDGTDSDLVSVTGDATLDGGAVAHIGATGEYDLRSTYTILSAGGTLSGAFGNVTSDFAFLTPDLVYDYGAGTVDLELARNDTDFASMALTRNQTATADGIESIGLAAGHAVYDAIALSADDDDLIRASYEALSGEIHASAHSALIEDSRFIRNAANDRIRAAFGSTGASVTPVLAYGPGDTPMAVAADHGGPVFWSHGFGSWGSTDGDGNAASLDRSTGGLLIGADTLVGDWRLGLLGGYSQSSFDAADRASSGSSTNYHLSLYGGTQWGDIALRTGAAYTWHDIETDRSLAIPGLTDTLASDYRAGTFQAFGELAYGVELDTGTRLEPFANLSHVSLHTDSFTEQGGAAALSGVDGSTDVTFTTLGLRGEHHLTLGTMDATLKGTLGWRHAFGDVTTTSAHAFSAGHAFTIAGAPIAEDSAIIEAGLDLNLTPDASFGLSYTGQISGEAQDHGFRANLTVRF